MTGTLHEDQYTFLVISRPVLLRIRNVSDRNSRENQNTFFFFLENSAVYEIMCKTLKEPDGPQMAHVLCMLDTKGYKHTLRICNTYCFFSLQQWLHERSSMLHYTYFACLVVIKHTLSVRFVLPSVLFPYQTRNIQSFQLTT
jgi:hypothetical protein